MQIIRSQAGSAMLASLAVLLMLGLIGIAAVNTSITDMNIAANYQSELSSFYIAEAGAELAYAVMRDTLTWRDGFNDRPFTDGIFRVVLWDSTINAALKDTVVVLSTGRRSEAVSNIELKLCPCRPFQRAAFADDYLKLCGGTTTDSYDSDSGGYALSVRLDGGDVGANGPADICGNTVVNGGAVTAEPGGMDITGSAIVTGDTSTTAPVSEVPPISQSELDYALANSCAPAGLAGSYTYDPGTRNLTVNPGQSLTLSGGVYYFDRVDIRGPVTLAPGARVKIYVTGDMIINACGAMNVGGVPLDLQIISVGNSLTLTGPAEIHAIVYAPETSVTLAGSSDLYGAVVGRTIDDQGSASIHFDRTLKDAPLEGTIEKVAWREL